MNLQKVKELILWACVIATSVYIGYSYMAYKSF